MRLLLPLLLVGIGTASTVFASECPTTTTSSVKVPYHALPWSPPTLPGSDRVAAGMIEGDPMGAAKAPGLWGESRAEALKHVVIEQRPDGSRHAVLGNAIRAWTVASVGEDGKLRLDCVSSEAAAKARVRVASSRGGK